MRSERILVTGASGLVGAYLIRLLLKEGYSNITGLIRSSSDLSLLGGAASKINFIQGDIIDINSYKPALKEIDYLIHTAAMVSFDPRDKKMMYDVNVNATAELVNQCLDQEIKKFVHISSVAALGRVKSGTTINESATWTKSHENSYYAVTKFQSELEVWRGIAEGLPGVIINPSIILGGGFWGTGSTAIIGKIAKGIPYYGTGGTGFVDVRDVARLINVLLSSDIIGERFICNGFNATYKQVFTRIAQCLNVQPPKKPLGKSVGELVWRLEKVRSWISRSTPLITKETIRTSRFTSIYDNSKSLELSKMHYLPMQKTIEDISLAYDDSKPFGLLTID